ncbi:uncharacterized protein [Ptychodera flava]
MREEASVHPENPYVFARQYNSKECQRGDKCLRLYAHSCGASDPERLTSINLRKHVATVSQFMNLSNNELDVLAGFLGHDINVHRNYYRLPQATLQVCKISRLLMSLERGDTDVFRGKTLEEIETEVVIDDRDENEEEVPVVSQNTTVTQDDDRTGEVQQESLEEELREVIADQHNVGHSAEGYFLI